MHGSARGPWRTVSTAGKSDILMPYGVPDFVASSVSQPRTLASRRALKRRTWRSGASKRQKNEAAQARPSDHLSSPSPASLTPPPPPPSRICTEGPPYPPSPSFEPPSPPETGLPPLPPCTAPRKSKGYRRSKQLYLGPPSEALRVRSYNIQKKQPDPFVLHNLSCVVGVQLLQELQEPPSLPSRSLFDGRHCCGVFP